MKLACLILVIFVGVFHDAHSGILIGKIGDTLGRIKCEAQSIGSRLFHQGQNHNLCDERQDREQQGHNDNQNWNPHTNRAHGNSDYNRGYDSNNNYYGNIARPFPSNQGFGNVNEPTSNNIGYGYIGQSVPVQQGYRSTARPYYNKVEYEYGYGHGLGQPNEQNSGSLNGPSNKVGYGNIGQPYPNNQYSESKISVANGKRTELTTNDISNQNAGKQSQNCTVIDIRSNSNDQTGVANNCTQDGRSFLSNVKPNCPAGEVADKNGVCREEYKR